jgi:hypothetical protein
MSFGLGFGFPRRSASLPMAIFILDQISAPSAAAYSLRKLRAAYAGSAIRVRRSTDNAEIDIGFTSTGELDTTALLNHVGYENLLLRSEEVNQSPWVLDNVGATNPVITANFASAPDGTMTADRVQLNKTGGTFARVRQDSAQPSNTYTYSVYLKNNSAGVANVGISIEGVGVNCVVTQDWQRFSVTKASTTVPDCQILLFNSIVGNDNTADILVWGNQLNTGATPKPYQQTVATALTANGFVTTWYDQSGNARNATQATAGAQPQIVSAGAVITEGGRPLISFDGLTQFLSLPTSGAPTQNSSLIGVFRTTNAVAGSAGIINISNDTDNPEIRLGVSTGGSATTYRAYWNGVYVSIDNPAVNFQNRSVFNASFVSSGGVTTNTVRVDGSDALSASRGGTWGGVQEFTIGRYVRTSSNRAGIAQELISIQSVLSTTDRQTLETNPGAYYNITVA